jgi:hypothetical protein
MSESEFQNLKITIGTLGFEIDRLMKNKVVTENEDLKRVVGELAFDFATFLDIKFLPKLKRLHPSFSED